MGDGKDIGPIMMVASCVSVGIILTVNLNEGPVNVGVTDCNTPGPYHVVKTAGYPGVELAAHLTLCINISFASMK